MRLILLRHSEIDEKYKGTYIGHKDISLSENGKLKAIEVCKHLDNFEFDSVFCSDLKRSKETLKYSKHYKNAIFTKLLREKSWGRDEGLSFDQICTRDNYTYDDFKKWLDHLDGEDYSLFIQRVELFFLEYLRLKNYNNVLVVTHAGVIRVLLMILNNVSLEEAFSVKIDYAKMVYIEIL